MFDPQWAGRTARIRPKPAPPKRSTHEIVAELTDELVDVDSTFATTYHPSRHEEGWLLSSLAPFYDKGLITDVLSLIKGGKEASVYRCRAHPATGLDVVAAKVYRPRMFRNLRNDKMYRQGREVLTEDGRPAGHEAGRIARAIRNRSTFGLRAEHTAWLMYEFTALETLWAAGAAVPQPLASGENGVLMSYHGDEERAAPTLNTVTLEPEEARVLFGEVLRNVELMLRHGLIHGDLSAYNILYVAPRQAAGGSGQIVLIDFPQVVSLEGNEKARFVLERDIQRVCEYFVGQGVPCRPQAIAHELWARYGDERRPEDAVADWSRFEDE
jgi:RIO kinase 1